MQHFLFEGERRTTSLLCRHSTRMPSLKKKYNYSSSPPCGYTSKNNTPFKENTTLLFGRRTTSHSIRTPSLSGKHVFSYL